MMLLGLLFGLMVGLTLGLLGGGGSILTVPIFVFIFGIETKTAIAMSLAVVGVTSLFGAYGHWREDHIETRLALFFGLFAVLAGFVGGKLSHFLSGDVQLFVFAIVMLVAAVFMARRRPAAEIEPRVRPLLFMALPAVGVGLLTGLIGVGGGFLIVPALVLLGGVPMKQAVGSSLLVIAMTALASFGGHMTRELPIDWAFTALFTAVAVSGSLLGTRLVPRIPQETLRKAFALFLILMGLLILYMKRAVFLGP
jgi:uncharacterized protein